MSKICKIHISPAGDRLSQKVASCRSSKSSEATNDAASLCVIVLRYLADAEDDVDKSGDIGDIHAAVAVHISISFIHRG